MIRTDCIAILDGQPARNDSGAAALLVAYHETTFTPAPSLSRAAPCASSLSSSSFSPSTEDVLPDAMATLDADCPHDVGVALDDAADDYIYDSDDVLPHESALRADLAEARAAGLCPKVADHARGLRVQLFLDPPRLGLPAATMAAGGMRSDASVTLTLTFPFKTHTANPRPPEVALDQMGDTFPIGQQLRQMLELYLARCWRPNVGFVPPQPLAGVAAAADVEGGPVVLPFNAQQGFFVHMAEYLCFRAAMAHLYCVICDRVQDAAVVPQQPRVCGRDMCAFRFARYGMGRDAMESDAAVAATPPSPLVGYRGAAAPTIPLAARVHNVPPSSSNSPCRTFFPSSVRPSQVGTFVPDSDDATTEITTTAAATPTTAMSPQRLAPARCPRSGDENTLSMMPPPSLAPTSKSGAACSATASAVSRGAFSCSEAV